MIATKHSQSPFRRALLPGLVFILAWVIHYVWLGVFPEDASVQSKWIAINESPASIPSWSGRYIEAQSYFLSFSYALSLAFAVISIRKYREQQFCGARNLAIGGVTLSGFLAFAGCFLIGCCGSPMLAVYLNLFGARFLPFAKPILAGVSFLSVTGAWIWMERRSGQLAVAMKPTGSCGPATDDCGCTDSPPPQRRT